MQNQFRNKTIDQLLAWADYNDPNSSWDEYMDAHPETTVEELAGFMDTAYADY